MSYSVKKVLGLLPARGGSKGIPRKNVRMLHGRPLVQWAASALASAELVDRAVCSTDDPEIARAAAEAGLEVPWMRPAELSQDTTLVVDVVLHALDRLDADCGEIYDYVAIVQATSPTVMAADIDSAVNMAISNDADTVITGFPVGQRHPATMFSMSESKRVNWLMAADQRMARRQDLPSYYIRSGLVYLVKVSVIREARTLYGNRIFCLEIPEERALTIDEERDFKIAEFMLTR
jgi:CMP-N,N'-diacetyllegionaminic acid synthase